MSESIKESLNELMSSKEVAFIPCGFRCRAELFTRHRLGIKQKSLPFNTGFFPPESVANLILNPVVNLTTDFESQCPCTRSDYFNDEAHGTGMKFKTMTYDEIDNLILNKDQPDLMHYLDSTFAYYTLDRKNKYVIAHHNWHKISKPDATISKNMERINTIINRRLMLFKDLCKSSRLVVFIHRNIEEFDYMDIDEDRYGLRDFGLVDYAFRRMFKTKHLIVDSKDIEDPEILLDKINTML